MRRRQGVSSLISGGQRDSLSPTIKILGVTAAVACFLVLSLYSPSASTFEGSSLAKLQQADASAVERLKRVDARLRIEEAEVRELAKEREKLMKTVFPDAEDEDEDPAVNNPALLYAGRTLPGNTTCQQYPDSGPNCQRTPVQLDLPYPKVYVYELPSKFNSDLYHKYKRCASDQYGTEVFYHEALLKSELRVYDPEQATLFFVPIYGECFLWQWEMLKHESRENSYKLTNDFFLEAMKIVTTKYPYWARTEGRDHVFVFPGARGPTIFSDWQTHIVNSIYLTPEGDRKAFYYNTWKDVVIPGMEFDPQFYLPSNRQPLLDNPPERKFLAYFRGTIFHREGNAYSRGLRPRLHALFQNQTDIIYDTKRKDCDRACYKQEMAESVFCLNPLGWTPWTLRFYQAAMTRCIPVMIADDIEFPYENTIDYSEFVLKIREKDVDNIVEIMRSMPEEERERRRRAIDRIWTIFTYQRPPQEGDAFYATMAELARKHRVFKTSSQHEWT